MEECVLHEPLMDRSKPLWEFHITDKVEGGRFAMYTKIHHAYADGVTMARWMMQSMSPAPAKNTAPAIWEQAGTLYFGLVATSKVVGLHSLSRCIEEAFDELEESVYPKA